VISSRKRLVRSLLGGGAALLMARTSFAEARGCVASSSDSGPTTAGQWTAPLNRLITVHAADLSLRNALERVASAASLRFSYSAELLPLDRVVCLAADGVPVGKVLDELLVRTNVSAVPAGGDQVVLAPLTRSARPAPTPEPDDAEMARSLGVLDRVVVTGSAVGSPERQSTVGVDVVTGRQLTRQNTSTLSSALDSYVPGVWSWSQSPSAVLNSYASIRGASSFGLSYPKIYIDGIEVANPLLISRFAPEAIDRIEVIRGPQGSALYGADAISGVINIVTRHDGLDVDGFHASVRSTAGVTQGAYTHGVLSQEHALSIVTGTSTRSADLHVMGGSIGDFIPNGYSRDLLASGSARVVGENGTLSGTARFFTQDAGRASSPLISRPPITTGGSATGDALGSQSTLAPQSVQEYTLGATATTASGERWTHSLVAGIDGYRLANVETTALPIPTVADSALRAAQGRADRATIRASSVLRLRADEPTNASLTFSAEHSELRESAVSTPVTTLGGRDFTTRATNAAVIGWQSSTGVTTQASAAIGNALFLNGGVRLEHDSRLAGVTDVVALPMLGAAAVGDFGPVTAKLRAAYGKGIRPVSALGRGQFAQAPYGPTGPTTLGAERQAGTEVGIDFLIRRAWSFKVTRFDQRASGLIQQVAIPADTSSLSHRMTYAFENVGEISNRGWEFEAGTELSRLSVSSTLSFVDSRVQQLAKDYNGDLMTGDRMLQVPSSTGSLNLSWLGEHWYASLAGSRAFNWINYDELALTKEFLDTNRSAHDLLGVRLRQYWRTYNGGLRLRALASRDLRDTFSIQISAENLLNYQRDEPDNITVVPGRTIMTGFRVKF
jgi:outer membrane cobalamin receptor